MILTLHTETTIDSCHKLVNYNGNCSRMHGHTWFLEIWIRGSDEDLNKVGILYDFSNVKKIKEKFDHRFLNEIPPFDKINPTAENISKFIYEELKNEDKELQFKVRLYETKVGKETWCELGDW